MAAPALIATQERHHGVAVIDASTGVHFGIGAAAGLSGIDPKIALLIALCAEAAYEIMQTQDPHAVFHRGVGESKANQITDLLAMVAGAYLGHGIRDKIREQPEPAPPAPATAGLGATTTGHNYAAVWARSGGDWNFLGYAPSDTIGQQVARALNYYAAALKESGTYYYSFATAYPVPVNAPLDWGSSWYLLKVVGRQGQWWNYGHYTVGDAKRIVFALRWLLQDSVNNVIATDNSGYGYSSPYATTGIYSYSEYPARVA